MADYTLHRESPLFDKVIPIQVLISLRLFSLFDISKYKIFSSENTTFGQDVKSSHLVFRIIQVINYRQ